MANDSESEITQKEKEELDELLNQRKETSDSLVDILHQVQELIGYLPREVQIKVAKTLEVPLSEVYSVVSFYSLFTTEKSGEHRIEICTGTACYVKGSDELLAKCKQDLNLEPGQISEDGKFSLKTSRCVGTCGMAPVVVLEGKNHGSVTADGLMQLIDSLIQ